MLMSLEERIDRSKQKTFFVSGLGIEVMGEDIVKASYEIAKEIEKITSTEGWRLPKADECFVLWSIKQSGCGNIKDSYYWTGEERDASSYGDKDRMAFMFKMDTPFLGTRSKQDFYYIRLVRDI
jgi:hypothetical protein